MSNTHARATFILKCTRNCNFSCRYCTDHSLSSSVLSIKTAAKLIKGACSRFRGIDFVFHGGEPLLLGTSYFRKFISIIALSANKHHEIRNLIQTNGSLINNEWCTFIKNYGVKIGVSLDGPPDVHNLNRIFTNSKPTYSHVNKGIKNLIKNDIHFGILTVVTKELLKLGGENTFNFFADYGFKEIAFLIERPDNTDKSFIKLSKNFIKERLVFADFLSSVCKAWLHKNDPDISVRELSNKVSILLGSQSKICCEGGTCVGKYFGIDTDGNISHCDRFFNHEILSYGNINNESIESIMDSEIIVNAIKYEEGLRSQCTSCKWFELCRGGCLYEAFLFAQSGLKDRWEYCHNYFIFNTLKEYFLNDIFEEFRLN